MEIDWCVRMHAVCLSVSRFCFRYFYVTVFCILSAQNRVIATNVCGNMCCFLVLRVGILACGDEIDGMIS